MRINAIVLHATMLFTVKGNTTRVVLGGEVFHSKGSRFDFKTTLFAKNISMKVLQYYVIKSRNNRLANSEGSSSFRQMDSCIAIDHVCLIEGYLYDSFNSN